MDQLVEGTRRRRALIELPVERGRRRDVGRVLARAHVVVAVDLDVRDGAESSFADEAVARGGQMRRAASLRADLHDALVCTRRGQHRLPFGDVDADGLLHVDVGAALHGLDHRQRMPMIWRADEDDVEVLLPQHLAIVLVRTRPLPGRLTRRHEIRRLRHHGAVDITQRDDLDRGHLHKTQEIGLSIPARADEADALLHVGELFQVA